MRRLLGGLMEKITVWVTWRDSCGTKISDATTLARLPGMIHFIKKAGGRVRGVRVLEILP
jgi:hypothetical protein